MKRPAYETRPNAEKTLFEFESNGEKGTIPKIVLFDREGEQLWNLAFGDKIAGFEFDDKVITNNKDLWTVIQTIANIVHEFLEAHPGHMIQIRPVDAKRKMLYNAIFRRKWAEIKTSFTVFAVSMTAFGPYNPQNDYEIFVVSKKWGSFEK
ncbi:MAG: hypothetical protein EPO28_06830 [Saprospiraceae bacterium]|nr:MAG: hypothetical protein EPO28_06830 [Saprospiraceae bacterium]